MRNEKEIMELLLGYARQDERVRMVTLEGSRTNPSIKPDLFQDYDISYFVTEMDTYKSSDGWLDVFGPRLILQKPEDMELFPPEMGNWFSYLMLLADGNKVDLTLIPLEEMESYFAKSDGLVEVLLDKDGRVPDKPVPTDKQYWIKKPTAREFDDCCNEFWWVATYVAKGLARGEILFALDHLNGIVRPNLLRMLSWEVGIRKGFRFSVGKNYKFIQRHLPPQDWERVLASFNMSGYEEAWQALGICLSVFRSYSQAVAQQLNYPYPDYDEQVTPYLQEVAQKGK